MFPFGLIALFLSSLLVSLYGSLNRPSFKPLYGYRCLQGEVFSTSYNKVWFISKGHPYYFYSRRRLYPSDEIKICGPFRGIKVKPKRLEVERSFIQNLRVKLHNALKSQFLKRAQTKVEKKLISALLFGENWFSKRERKRLSLLGIYHLIVISGMHYALLFSFFLIFPVRWKLRYYLAFGFFAIFTLLVLFPKAPAYRAFFSFALFLIAKIWERNYSSLKALLFAYVVSLLLFPYWFSSVGFWLSYLVSGALILYYGARKVPEESFLNNFFGKFLGLEATLVVSAVLLPLLAAYFHFFSFGSFLYSFPFTFVVQGFLMSSLLNLFTAFSFEPFLYMQHFFANAFGYLFYNLPTLGVVKTPHFPKVLAYILPPLILITLMVVKERKLRAVALIFGLELLLLGLF